MTALLVLAGGAIGAPMRYVLDRYVQHRFNSVFPWGTLCVNVIGSLLLGLLLGAGTSHQILAFAGFGLCGALTTFSTFGFDTLRLLEDGSILQAGLNALGSLVLGLVAAVGGFAAGGAVAPLF